MMGDVQARKVIEHIADAVDVVVVAAAIMLLLLM